MVIETKKDILKYLNNNKKGLYEDTLPIKILKLCEELEDDFKIKYDELTGYFIK